MPNPPVRSVKEFPDTGVAFSSELCCSGFSLQSKESYVFPAVCTDEVESVLAVYFGHSCLFHSR